MRAWGWEGGGKGKREGETGGGGPARMGTGRRGLEGGFAMQRSRSEGLGRMRTVLVSRRWIRL